VDDLNPGRTLGEDGATFRDLHRHLKGGSGAVSRNVVRCPHLVGTERLELCRSTERVDDRAISRDDLARVDPLGEPGRRGVLDLVRTVLSYEICRGRMPGDYRRRLEREMGDLDRRFNRARDTCRRAAPSAAEAFVSLPATRRAIGATAANRTGNLRLISPSL
jgi:hypothetical protein